MLLGEVGLTLLEDKVEISGPETTSIIYFYFYSLPGLLMVSLVWDPIFRIGCTFYMLPF